MISIKGLIIKSDRGIYFVKLTNGDEYQCKARGLFRKEDKKPLVGDYVDIRISDEDGSGYIEELYPRVSELLRPPVANINQVIILMSIREPDINLRLLDKYLLMTEKADIKTIIVFNKTDLIEQEEKDYYQSIYEDIGYDLYFNSNVEGTKLHLKELLEDKTTAITGPSGVGKSTTLSYLFPDKSFPIGEISQKLRRGKNTTRHTEIKDIGFGYILDTPGFSSLSLDFIDNKEEIPYLMKDFQSFISKCSFKNCMHLNEPDCGVKKAVESNEIAESRYKNYVSFVEEYEEKRRY